MLSREWCEKLKGAGYPQDIPYFDEDGPKVAYQDENHSGVMPATIKEYLGGDYLVSKIPSGDELLAECVKLFPNQEWSLRRTTFADGRSCVTLCDGDPNRVGKIFHACSKGEPNADLAQAWIWLKERKDAD